jgi:hypothetical protein
MQASRYQLHEASFISPYTRCEIHATGYILPVTRSSYYMRHQLNDQTTLSMLHVLATHYQAYRGVGATDKSNFPAKILISQKLFYKFALIWQKNSMVL